MSKAVEGSVALEGKVALLLNEREIVINIGSEQGVVEHQRFGVYLPKPVEVRSPETNEVLGEIDDIIIEVIAERVNQKFTICAAIGQRTIGGRPASIYAMTGLVDAIPERVVPMTFRASDSTKPRPIDEKDSVVRVGYRVKALPPQD